MHLSRGATLTEMLVAVIILSVGMVTVLGMLNDSISSLTHSLHHQRAAQLSTNLAEVLSGLHANAAWPTVAPANFHCETAICEPAELLAHIVDDWQQQIARQLPGARGAFRFVTNGGQPMIEIRLEWRNRGGDAANFVTLVPVSAMAEAP